MISSKPIQLSGAQISGTVLGACSGDASASTWRSWVMGDDRVRRPDFFNRKSVAEVRTGLKLLSGGKR